MTATVTALRPPRRRSRIGLTALIDVVFILLMFFMLTSSFTRQHEVVFQVSAAGEQITDTLPALLVLQADRQLRYYPTNSNAAPQLVTTLDELLPGIPANEPLTLLPEPATELQFITDIMAALQQAGVAAVLGQTIPAAEERRP